MKISNHFDVIVIGGGHAGAEAAWAGSNLGATVAFITMDPAKTGTMSCNPAIGGLAKGQMVREIDAMGGLMGLATDATGIQFRMLNLSKGPAVWGPRAQCDKYRYAREVQRLLSTRPSIITFPGTVEKILVSGPGRSGKVTGVQVAGSGLGTPGPNTTHVDGLLTLTADAVVLTTGTFMRGLMHTGEKTSVGGRVGENASVGISGALRELGFDLGRLKTGTPPRLAAESIDFSGLPLQPGDDVPIPFSDLSGLPQDMLPAAPLHASPALARFPVQPQMPCWITHTSEPVHELIRANLHRAPMYNGQIQTQGPRYCPSIEDKVVRFADRGSHHVYLEPESLETNEIYCNGISTSLPADVQEFIVRNLPGCQNAKILRYGYAVEYDMVWPHQIDATGMTKVVDGLFLAGQINGTSGYEEAAGQGMIAGINAVRHTRRQPMIRLGRDQAYVGVMMDDLVTKTPREPYRMFTSRAEHRLLLRADNADERLTPLGRELGLVDDHRWSVFEARQDAIRSIRKYLTALVKDGQRMIDYIKRPEMDTDKVLAMLDPGAGLPALAFDKRLIARVVSDIQYAGYIEREARDVQKLRSREEATLPIGYDYSSVIGLRTEAVHVLNKFKPATYGQAARLAGVTPADLMVVSVALGR